jgi:hypothetical protein
MMSRLLVLPSYISLAARDALMSQRGVALLSGNTENIENPPTITPFSITDLDHAQFQ